MKKDFAFKITSLGLALLCGATFALGSCGDKKGNDENETTEDPSTEIITADPAGQTETDSIPLQTLPVEDDSVREPVDEPRAQMLVKYYYDLAMQVYNWVYTECMPITVEGGVEQDGDIYYPVVAVFETALLDDATIETYDDLKAYISALFDKPIADILIDATKANYRDINGVLYSKPISTSEENNNQVTREEFLSAVGSESFRYTVKETATVDGETTVVFKDYIYKNTAYGWLWTAFPLITD